MKKFNTYFLSLMVASLAFTACDEEDDILAKQEAENPIPPAFVGDPGALDFTNYVALGNSITAGLMDAALYTDGQAHSFPNLLAQQLQANGVNGGTFSQPDINSANGYSGPGADGVPGTSDDLGRLELSLSQLKPVPTAGEAPTEFTGDKSTLNNFGVPGMRVVDVNSPALASNPYYGRFATTPGVSTVLGDALATNPSFFTYWLGNNDILGYAVDGGVDPSSITSQGDFQQALQESLGGLVQSGAQGAVMTLPLFVTLPYFNAVPYNAITLDAATVTQLNAGFDGYNQALQGLVQLSASGLVPGLNVTQADADQRMVVHTTGANPIVMNDDDLTDYSRPGGEFDILMAAGFITPAQRQALEPFGQTRFATSNDRPVLPAATQLGTPYMGNANAVIGVSWPAADGLILSEAEAEVVVGTRATYNAIIAAVVDGINQQAGSQAITLVDVQPAFADIAGLDAATASFLVDPTMGANPALAAMAANAATAADGEQGIEVDGVNLAPDFSPNGIYSTDGIHPNPRGHAIIANVIIDALNAGKSSVIPSVDVLFYRSIIATQ